MSHTVVNCISALVRPTTSALQRASKQTNKQTNKQTEELDVRQMFEEIRITYTHTNCAQVNPVKCNKSHYNKLKGTLHKIIIETNNLLKSYTAEDRTVVEVGRKKLINSPKNVKCS
jgi:ABC-type branched-subunit amino acid transport system ATPase component